MTRIKRPAVRRRSLVVMICAAVCVLSMFLPALVLALRDMSLTSSPSSVPVEEIQLSLVSDLTSVEKLHIVGTPQATVLPATDGRNLDEYEAEGRADDYAMLFIDRPLAWTVQPEMWTLDGDGLLAWHLTYSDTEGESLDILLDDETGCILRLVMDTVFDEKEWKNFTGEYGIPRPSASSENAKPAKGSVSGEISVPAEDPVEGSDTPSTISCIERLAEWFIFDWGIMALDSRIETDNSMVFDLSARMTENSSTVYVMGIAMYVTDTGLHIEINPNDFWR